MDVPSVSHKFRFLLEQLCAHFTLEVCDVTDAMNELHVLCKVPSRFKQFPTNVTRLRSLAIRCLLLLRHSCCGRLLLYSSFWPQQTGLIIQLRCVARVRRDFVDIPAMLVQMRLALEDLVADAARQPLHVAHEMNVRHVRLQVRVALESLGAELARELLDVTQSVHLFDVRRNCVLVREQLSAEVTRNRFSPHHNSFLACWTVHASLVSAQR